MKLESNIFLEEINDRKDYGSLLIHKLLSWKILILTLKSPRKMHMKQCENPGWFRTL